MRFWNVNKPINNYCEVTEMLGQNQIGHIILYVMGETSLKGF